MKADRRELKTLTTNLETQKHIVTIVLMTTWVLGAICQKPLPWMVLGQNWPKVGLAIALETKVEQRPSLHQGCHWGVLRVPAHPPLLVHSSGEHQSCPSAARASPEIWLLINFPTSCYFTGPLLQLNCPPAQTLFTAPLTPYKDPFQ